MKSKKGWNLNMQMDWSYVGAVVISGLVLVFVALILLIAAVWLMGKIFDAVKGKKNDKTEIQTKETTVDVPVKPADTAQIAEEDEGEIIAVIAAAVAAMSEESGKTLKIHSIKRAGAASRSNAWARAAAGESTRSF